MRFIIKRFHCNSSHITYKYKDYSKRTTQKLSINRSPSLWYKFQLPPSESLCQVFRKTFVHFSSMTSNFLDNACTKIQNVAFKTSKMDQIALEYCYYGFLGRLRVDGRGFLHQKPILKKRSPEQKSRCRTDAQKRVTVPLNRIENRRPAIINFCYVWLKRHSCVYV